MNIKKDTYAIQIGFALIILVAFLLGIPVGVALNPKPAINQIVFEKDYMLTSYPIAGEQEHLYIIDFQFTDLQEVVGWIKQYEGLRRKENE